MASSFRVPEELPVPRTTARGGEPDHPVLVQVALSRSATLARQGRYDEAERLLSELRLSSHQAVPVLHLRARILAQQGRLMEAAEDWKRVLSTDPRHESAAAGLREIALLLRRPPLIGAFLSWPVAGVLLMGLLWIALSSRGRPDSEQSALTLEVRKATADLERVRERQEALARSQERIEGALTKGGAVPAYRKPPSFEAKIPGITFKSDGEDLAVQFTETLFDPGSAELRGGVRALVADLAARLAPEAGRIQVRITVEVGKPVVESSALALSRARNLADQLRKPGPSNLVVTTELRTVDPADSSQPTVVPDPPVRVRLSAAKN
jgi:type VI secretion system protein ImpK